MNMTIRTYLKLALLIVAILVVALSAVSFGDVEIFWNETGYYIKVSKFPNITLDNYAINAFYNFSNYNMQKVMLNLTAGNLVNITATNITTVYVGGENVTLLVAPHICVYVASTDKWYCGYETGAKYVITSPPGEVEAEIYYNTCVTVLFQKLLASAPSTTAIVEIYDYYTQKLLLNKTFTEPGYVTICGVPDKVLLNVTLGGKWLGMFYITTHMPTVIPPSNIAPYLGLLLLGFFIAFAVRNRATLGGLGAIIFGGVFAAAIIAAFGLQTVYGSALGLAIASLSIVLGVVMLLFSSKK